MPNRREFLQGGIALSLLPLLPRKGLSAAAPKAFDMVIFDQRFPKARDFALQARAAGLECVAIDGDITNLYFHDLSLALESRSDHDCRAFDKSIPVLFGNART